MIRTTVPIQRKPRRRSRGWLWLGVAGAILAVAAWLAWGWLHKAKPIPPEKLVKAEKGDIARAVVAVGKVEPLSKVQVKSKANGIITSLLVDVGAQVKEGQVLAELDKENLAAALREATATLNAEQANLKVVIAAEAKARIEAANPELEFARREAERVERLFQDKIASQQALEDGQRAHEVAINKRQLLEAAATSASALVEQARARVAAAQAALDRMQENLNYATIRSPINGIVLTRDTEVGDAVSSILNMGSAATLIMTLGDMSTVYVKGEVDQADVGKINMDLSVRTRVESFPKDSFTGQVTRIAPIGKEKDNVTTFEVRVSLPNPEGKLRVAMSANAEIVLEEHKGVLLVPEAALVYDKDGKTSVQKRQASSKVGWVKTPVKTGISNGQRTEIQEGLQEGTELVLP
jgi:HlyD family secretion protein